MANDGGGKAYVHSLGEALHYGCPADQHTGADQIGPRPANNADETDGVEQCVSEALKALRDRSRIISGRTSRIMNVLIPASVKRTMTAKLLGKALANKLAPHHVGITRSSKYLHFAQACKISPAVGMNRLAAGVL